MRSASKCITAHTKTTSKCVYCEMEKLTQCVNATERVKIMLILFLLGYCVTLNLLILINNQIDPAKGIALMPPVVRLLLRCKIKKIG